MFVAIEKCDGISGCYLALLQDCEVESGQAAIEKTLQHVVASKLDPKFVAGQAWLGHGQNCGADAKAVADMHGVVHQTGQREILTEHRPGEMHMRKFRAPV